jgi:hypothetical protein
VGKGQIIRAWSRKRKPLASDLIEQPAFLERRNQEKAGGTSTMPPATCEPNNYGMSTVSRYSAGELNADAAEVGSLSAATDESSKKTLRQRRIRILVAAVLCDS